VSLIGAMNYRKNAIIKYQGMVKLQATLDINLGGHMSHIADVTEVYAKLSMLLNYFKMHI
jgi:hypothetical protein